METAAPLTACEFEMRRLVIGCPPDFFVGFSCFWNTYKLFGAEQPYLSQSVNADEAAVLGQYLVTKSLAIY